MNKCNNIQAHHAQAGLGLISALFVITVLALLAAGMASLNVSSAQTHTQQIINIRAQSAANSALQIYQAQTQTVNTVQCSEEPVKYQYDTAGLYDCAATVSCRSIPYQTNNYITLSVNASCGTGLDSAGAQLTERFIRPLNQ